MSEYQCYEFLAVDRPLTDKEIRELRAISTRATISPARFWNEYQWGDLKADPGKLLERYFDAHMYFANWGTRRLMFRVPKSRVDVGAISRYLVGGPVRLRTTRSHAVLHFVAETEEPEYDDEAAVSLSALSALRAELIRGDLRPAYLAWLLAVQDETVGPDAREPPVPAGLADLSSAQEAMVDFLRIDADLLTAAAAASDPTGEQDGELRRWALGQPQRVKDRWLSMAADEPDLPLGGELLRAFRAARGAPDKGSRTVDELVALAETARAKRERAEAARAKKARTAAENARRRRLDALEREGGEAWTRLESLVATSRYDEAVRLAVDLRDLAARRHEDAEFSARFDAMRKRNARRRGFFDRWRRASEGRPW